MTRLPVRYQHVLPVGGRVKDHKVDLSCPCHPLPGDVIGDFSPARIVIHRPSFAPGREAAAKRTSRRTVLDGDVREVRATPAPVSVG